ncbi:MAG: hypothetical protein ACFCUJ_00620 [Thiotrichales bacterium]
MTTARETIERTQDAFGRGDIATLLTDVADNVDWHLIAPLALS